MKKFIYKQLCLRLKIIRSVPKKWQHTVTSFGHRSINPWLQLYVRTPTWKNQSVPYQLTRYRHHTTNGVDSNWINQLNQLKNILTQSSTNDYWSAHTWTPWERPLMVETIVGERALSTTDLRIPIYDHLRCTVQRTVVEKRTDESKEKYNNSCLSNTNHNSAPLLENC